MTVAELQQMKTAKEQEIASLKQQLQHIKVEIPDITDDEKDALEEQRLRAGAEAYMDYDPNTAYSWLQQAENLKAKRELSAATLEEKQRKERESKDIDSIENVKQLAVQYRNARSAYSSDTWANLPEAERKQVDAEIKGLRTQLMKTELGRALIGEVDITSPTPADSNLPPTDKETDTPSIDKASVAGLIKSAADSDLNGIVDNIDEVESAISLIASALGEGNPDVKAVRAAWTAKQKDIQATADKKRIDEERDYSRGRQLYKDIADAGTVLYGIKTLRENPNNVSAKAGILTSVLRKESGAAIAESEFGRRMQTWLGPADYNRMVEEMTSAGVIIAGKIAPQASDAIQQRIINRYLQKVSAKNIDDFASSMVPRDVLTAYFKQNKVDTSKTLVKPNPKDYKDYGSYQKAYAEYRAKGGK